jgi:hypothetical protein
MKSSKSRRTIKGILLALIPLMLSGCYTQLTVIEEKHQKEESYEHGFYDGVNSGYEFRDYEVYRFWNPSWMDFETCVSCQFNFYSSYDPYFATWRSPYNYWRYWDPFMYPSGYAGWYFGAFYWRGRLYNYPPYWYYGSHYGYPYIAGRYYDYGEEDLRLSGIQRVRYGVTELDLVGIQRPDRLNRYRSSSSSSSALRTHSIGIFDRRSRGNHSGSHTVRVDRSRSHGSSSGTKVRRSSGSRSESSSGSSKRSGRSRSGSDDH